LSAVSGTLIALLYTFCNKSNFSDELLEMLKDLKIIKKDEL